MREPDEIRTTNMGIEYGYFGPADQKPSESEEGEEAQIAEARVAIEKAGGTWHEEKGCLELLIFLPLIGVIYYAHQILSG